VTEGLVKVLVVEDYEPWRSFYWRELRKRTDLHIVAGVSDGFEAIQQALEQQPDLILLDIGLPGLNGIDAARRIREACPSSKILFVSQEVSADVVGEAMSTGASGYVVKFDARSDLLPAIEAVLGGRRFLSASLDSLLV
jgi:DNA-binding NarL/FixJ family response regulator